MFSKCKNNFRGKILKTFLIFLLSFCFVFPPQICYATISPMIADFLCERGQFYYTQGKYPKALDEFKKALLANPESKTAKEFIVLIEQGKITVNALPQKDQFLKEIPAENMALEIFQQKAIGKNEAVPTHVGVVPSKEIYELSTAVVTQRKGKVSKKLTAAAVKESLIPKETIIDIHQKIEGKDSSNIETNVAARLVMRGKNIVRFLITNPALLKATRQNTDGILVEPQGIGSCFMHFWDEQGLKTLKFDIGPRRFEEEQIEAAQQRFQEEIQPQSFKFGYSIESDTFMTGRGFGDLKQKSHTMSYSSSLIGETPYGNFDAAILGTRTNFGTYNVTNLRMGLTGGHYDQFKDINLRFFDLSPSFNAFGFPGSDLRGALVDAPMFNKRLNYTAFWGALPQGNFTQLESSSGMTQTRDAYLEGIGVNYKIGTFGNFKSFYAHSYGSELTAPVLTNDVTGFGTDYYFGRFNIGTEMAYDMRHSISYTAHSNFNLSKLRIGLSMTENNKNFASLLGGAANSGSTSGALSLSYQPTQSVMITNMFTGNRDKVFGNPNNPTRPNYYSVSKLRWVLDTQTELEFGYTMNDLIGTISPSVTESKEVTLRKKIFFFKTLNTYIDFENSKSKNYSSSSQDFNNNRILMGLNFRVISDLYFFYNREFNFLKNKSTGETATPVAQEAGLNYYKQIFDTPFYINSRIFYRDEQNTASVLSYLSGEDRLEGEVELTFKPNPDSEAFLKCRVANIWAEKEGVGKHFDLDLNWGLRFIWDTGLRWEPVGGFSGYVFYDLNSDGLRQASEKGVKDVLIKSSGGKTTTTDGRGYYKISGIKGRRTMLEVDLKTIPKGYSPTTSVSRELDIVHARTKRIDFGIATRCEISGLVFNDLNNNGQYERGEESIKGVVVILDGKIKASSDAMGEYTLRKLSAGEHTLTLDLKTVPIKYIPKVAIQKKIRVLEGTAFIYNIPRVEQKKESPKK